jgi:cobyrinic acid a,c-diamide synthase
MGLFDGASDHAYSVRGRRSGDVAREGYQVGGVLASYLHAHRASNPLVAENVARACAASRGGAP